MVVPVAAGVVVSNPLLCCQYRRRRGESSTTARQNQHNSPAEFNHNYSFDILRGNQRCDAVNVSFFSLSCYVGRVFSLFSFSVGYHVTAECAEARRQAWPTAMRPNRTCNIQTVPLTEYSPTQNSKCTSTVGVTPTRDACRSYT